MADQGNWSGRKIYSEEDWQRGSEYGGVGGLIAPRSSGHDVADYPSEQLMLIYNTDPAVDGSGADLTETKLVRKYNG